MSFAAGVAGRHDRRADFTDFGTYAGDPDAIGTKLASAVFAYGTCSTGSRGAAFGRWSGAGGGGPADQVDEGFVAGGPRAEPRRGAGGTLLGHCRDRHRHPGAGGRRAIVGRARGEVREGGGGTARQRGPIARLRRKRFGLVLGKRPRPSLLLFLRSYDHVRPGSEQATRPHPLGTRLGQRPRHGQMGRSQGAVGASRAVSRFPLRQKNRRSAGADGVGQRPADRRFSRQIFGLPRHRARHQRGSPRRQPVARGQGGGRGRQPRQIAVSRQCESRTAHAAQRDPRFFGNARPGAAGSLDPRQREYVGYIRQSGAHLLDIINAILGFSEMLDPAPPDRSTPGSGNMSATSARAVRICWTSSTRSSTSPKSTPASWN